MPKSTMELAQIDANKTTSDDYTMYLTSDGYKLTLPWIIKDYEEKGALTSEQKRDLSERYGLDGALVDLLSLYVGNCLDVGGAIRFYPVTKSSAVKKGREAVRRALKQLKKGRSDEEVRADLAEIRSVFAEDTSGPVAETLIADKTLDLRSTLEKLMRIPDMIASKEPDDKRGIRDLRRISLVEHCCYIWEDAGRKITYSTVPSNRPGNQRVGKLFELITEVIGMTTKPSNIIPEETLRKDLDFLIKKHGWNLPEEERPDFMKEEPEFGVID